MIFTGYWDADLATPLEAIPDLLTLLEQSQGAHLAVAGSLTKVRVILREYPVKLIV